MPFLDVLVTHSDTKFSTNLYRKKLLPSYILTLIACHLSNVRSILYLFIYRAYRICSSYLSFPEQVCRRFLHQNRFPIYLINRIIKNILDRQFINQDKSENVFELPILIFLPYIGVHTVRLKKDLIKFLAKFYPHFDVRFVFQSAKRIEISFPLKIVPRVMFALQLFTRSCVVVARLIIVVKHHAISLLDLESI